MNESVTYRKPVPDDAAWLADLGRRTFAETFGGLYRAEDEAFYLAHAYAEDKVRAEIENPAFYLLVAWWADRPVGYVKAGPCKLPVDNMPAHAYEIYHLYLLKEVHGKGMADHLMREAMTWCHQKQAGSIFLGVWENNFRAQKFYARHGFVAIGNYYFPVGEHLDHEIIMQWQKETAAGRSAPSA